MSVFKELSLLFLGLFFTAFGGLIFLAQYLLVFWRYGFLGYFYSLWHVAVLLSFVLYIDYRRGKNLEKWRYENKPVTAKQIDDYVSLVKESQEEEKKEHS